MTYEELKDIQNNISNIQSILDKEYAKKRLQELKDNEDEVVGHCYFDEENHVYYKVLSAINDRYDRVHAFSFSYPITIKFGQQWTNFRTTPYSYGFDDYDIFWIDEPSVSELKCYKEISVDEYMKMFDATVEDVKKYIMNNFSISAYLGGSDDE